jgi:preprotein translocase subunit SecE
MFKKIAGFLKESWEELKKVVWPSKEEAVKSSIVVIVFVVVFSLFLAFMDIIINAFVIWMVG